MLVPESRAGPDISKHQPPAPTNSFMHNMPEDVSKLFFNDVRNAEVIHPWHGEATDNEDRPHGFVVLNHLLKLVQRVLFTVYQEPLPKPALRNLLCWS